MFYNFEFHSWKQYFLVKVHFNLYFWRLFCFWRRNQFFLAEESGYKIMEEEWRNRTENFWDHISSLFGCALRPLSVYNFRSSSSSYFGFFEEDIFLTMQVVLLLLWVSTTITSLSEEAFLLSRFQRCGESAPVPSWVETRLRGKLHESMSFSGPLSFSSTSSSACPLTETVTFSSLPPIG